MKIVMVEDQNNNDARSVAFSTRHPTFIKSATDHIAEEDHPKSLGLDLDEESPPQIEDSEEMDEFAVDGTTDDHRIIVALDDEHFPTLEADPNESR